MINYVEFSRFQAFKRYLALAQITILLSKKKYDKERKTKIQQFSLNNLIEPGLYLMYTSNQPTTKLTTIATSHVDPAS